MRPKKEDLVHTDFDPLFSKWKILVGPYDWKDYDLGKDGVERYRLHNLPLALSGPGTYELGIDLTATNESGRASRTINLADVISVYIGHTGNLRKRLQEYGRRGSHLENGKSDPYSEERRQGLFQGVFSRGFPILFRYHMTHDKNKAADLESKILKRFDYAWNNAGNGPVRQVDILSRLEKICSLDKHKSILTDLRKWLSPRIKKYVGAKITTSSPSNEDVYPDCKIGPGVFKTSKNRPSLVQPKGYSNDTMCGFRMVDGSVCGSRPDIEREENESMLVNRKSESDPVICGWVGADGYVCKNEPVSGRKRCEVHKGRRITKSVSSLVTPKESSPDVCGVTIADGSICMEPPVRGRKRCELHKGRRIMTKSSLLERNQISVSQAYQIVRPKESSSDVCGVTIANGSICLEPPVCGRKRCELHKGRRIMTKSSLVERNQIYVPQAYQIVRPQGSSSDVCGVIIGDGSICMESPVRGRKRCELHKGMRIVTKSSTYW